MRSFHTSVVPLAIVLSGFALLVAVKQGFFVSTWRSNLELVELGSVLPRSWQLAPSAEDSDEHLTPLKQAMRRSDLLIAYWEGQNSPELANSTEFQRGFEADSLTSLYAGSILWRTHLEREAANWWRGSSLEDLLAFLLARVGDSLKVEDNASAMEYWKMAHAIEPDDGRVSLARARIAAALDEPVQGYLAWLQLAATQAPYPKDAFTDLAAYYNSIGDYTESVSTLQIALERYPGRGEILYPLGRDLASIGQIKESIEVLTQYVSLSPGNATGWAKLGGALSVDGSVPAAVDAFLRAGELYSERGKQAQAEEAFCAARALEPDGRKTLEHPMAIQASCST